MFYIFWPFIFSGDVIKIYEVYLLNCIGNWWSPPGLSICRWWIIVDSDMWWQGQVMILLPEWSYLFKGQSSSTFNRNPQLQQACSWDDGSGQCRLTTHAKTWRIFFLVPWSTSGIQEHSGVLLRTHTELIVANLSYLPGSWFHGTLQGQLPGEGWLIWKAERMLEMPHVYMTCSTVFTLTG